MLPVAHRVGGGVGVVTLEIDVELGVRDVLDAAGSGA